MWVIYFTRLMIQEAGGNVNVYFEVFRIQPLRRNVVAAPPLTQGRRGVI